MNNPEDLYAVLHAPPSRRPIPAVFTGIPSSLERAIERNDEQVAFVRTRIVGGRILLRTGEIPTAARALITLVNEYTADSHIKALVFKSGLRKDFDQLVRILSSYAHQEAVPLNVHLLYPTRHMIGFENRHLSFDKQPSVLWPRYRQNA